MLVAMRAVVTCTGGMNMTPVAAWVSRAVCHVCFDMCNT